VEPPLILLDGPESATLGIRPFPSEGISGSTQDVGCFSTSSNGAGIS